MDRVSSLNRDFATRERATHSRWASVPTFASSNMAAPVTKFRSSTITGKPVNVHHDEAPSLNHLAALKCATDECNCSPEYMKPTQLGFTSLPDLSRLLHSVDPQLCSDTLLRKHGQTSLPSFDSEVQMPSARRSFSREVNRASALPDVRCRSMCNLTNPRVILANSDRLICSSTQLTRSSRTLYFDRFPSDACKLPCVPAPQKDVMSASASRRAFPLSSESGAGSSLAFSPEGRYDMEDLDSESADDLLPGFRRRRSSLSEASVGSSNESVSNDLLYSDQSDSDSHEINIDNATQSAARNEEKSPTQLSVCASRLSLEELPDTEIVNETELAEQVYVDADKDILNPAYVPRAGAYFMHDSRAPECGEGTEPVSATKSRADRDKWQHDLFRYHDQAPRSDKEIIRRYGRNIRKDVEDTAEVYCPPTQPSLADLACDRQSQTHSLAAQTRNSHYALTDSPSVSQAPARRSNYRMPHGRFTRSSAVPHVQTKNLNVDGANPHREYTGSLRTRHPPLHKSRSTAAQMSQTDSGTQFTLHSGGLQTKMQENSCGRQSSLIPPNVKRDPPDHMRNERIANQHHSGVDSSKEPKQDGSFPKRYSTLRQKSLLSAGAKTGIVGYSRFGNQSDTLPFHPSVESPAPSHLSNDFTDSQQAFNSVSIIRSGPSGNLHRDSTRSHFVHSDTRQVSYGSLPQRFSQPVRHSSSFDNHGGRTPSRNVNRNNSHNFIEGTFHGRQARVLASPLRACDDALNINHLSEYLEDQTSNTSTISRRPVLGKKPFTTQELRESRDHTTKTILVE